MSEITDFNGISNSKIRRGQKLLIDKTGLNWFKPVFVHVSEILIDKKRGGHTKC